MQNRIGKKNKKDSTKRYTKKNILYKDSSLFKIRHEIITTEAETNRLRAGVEHKK